MKKLLIVSSMLFAGSIGSIAQAQDRSPAINQSTSTTTTRSSAQTEKAVQEQAMPRPKLKERQRREQQIEDRRPTTPPENPKRFRPDSLRRGGAVKVDTVRR